MKRFVALLLLLAVPIAVEAQQARKPWRIGYLAQASPQVGSDTLDEFKRGLKELGYGEGPHYVLKSAMRTASASDWIGSRPSWWQSRWI